MTATRYVLVWREEGAARLRTYTSSKGRPLASPMDHIHPTPDRVIDEADDLTEWLNAPIVNDQVIAISDALARTELGWDPATMTEGNSE